MQLPTNSFRITRSSKSRLLREVLNEYDIDRTDLPKIKRTDAGLPNGAEVGDVVKIVRDSRTTDEAVIYRLVVE
jgi:DNA-directed RNA polymerase, subunit H (EC 2.7.7.6)